MSAMRTVLADDMKELDCLIADARRDVEAARQADPYSGRARRSGSSGSGARLSARTSSANRTATTSGCATQDYRVLGF